MIDKLKQAIQKANPEIMELKVGCKVGIANEPKPWAKQAMLVGHNPDNGLMYFAESDGSIFYTRGLKKEYKILGRPITLADVLIAIEEEIKTQAESEHSENQANYYQQHIGLAYSFILEKWNLQKDNLDDQTDETKKFLTDLLI